MPDGILIAVVPLAYYMGYNRTKLTIMRFIPTKVHGYLDYIVGALLIAAPWLFHFANGGAETWVPVILGAAAIIYSVLTDYELGVAHLIPMPAHLIMDLVSGILLAVSPWLFGFADDVYAPHLIIGIFEIGASLFTKRVPGTERGLDTNRAFTAH